MRYFNDVLVVVKKLVKGENIMPQDVENVQKGIIEFEALISKLEEKADE